MEMTKALDQLAQYQKKRYAYRYAMSQIFLDGMTVAPKDTAEGRGEALGVLSGAEYELTVNPDTAALLDFLKEREGELTPVQAREVSELLRGYEVIRKVPQDEYVAYQMLLNEAQSVWPRAKNANDFAAFAPYLEKIVEANRKLAGYMHPDWEPYDALLYQYERGLTMEKADRFFAQLRREIVPLLQKIALRPQIEDGFLFRDYPVEKQRLLSDRLMEMECIDRNHCAIGETEHPFTLNFTHADVRITTHYYPDRFASSLYSVIHEGGHALYELGISPEFDYTCLAGGVSMGIHESQSRLFENLIGRSEGFVNRLLPILREIFPEQTRDVDAPMLYLALNKVQPSLIRTEADELTYSLHIMVRYELEKRLIDGSLAVRDLPGEWNRLYKEYLGIDVPDDARGCLQDTHWSGGMIGYFPSYALGSAYACQMVEKMKGDLDWDACLAEVKLQPIVDWLKEHIHRFGCLYDPGALFERCVGAPFDPAFYTRYLTEKYSAIYRL